MLSEDDQYFADLTDEVHKLRRENSKLKARNQELRNAVYRARQIFNEGYSAEKTANDMYFNALGHLDLSENA